MMVRVEWQTGRPGGRVYVLGHRLHHGLVGIALSALGVFLCAHDRRDFPWLTDRP